MKSLKLFSYKVHWLWGFLALNVLTIVFMCKFYDQSMMEGRMNRLGLMKYDYYENKMIFKDSVALSKYELHYILHGEMSKE